MPLTEEDYETLRAESDAEPERFRAWDRDESFRKQHAGLHREDQQAEEPKRDENEIERLPTISSSSSAASTQNQQVRSRPSTLRSRSTTYDHDTDLHRSQTHMINGELERHPTALDRINTHRSQHFGTVGTFSIRKSKQLPKFGGGKPYPPALPDKEEYVVEFDGHDDLTHAQNWPFRKKYVNL
jgi:DHA1 family multidrug resistance protein-like MFS transporter